MVFGVGILSSKLACSIWRFKLSLLGCRDYWVSRHLLSVRSSTRLLRERLPIDITGSVLGWFGDAEYCLLAANDGDLKGLCCREPMLIWVCRTELWGWYWLYSSKLRKTPNLNLLRWDWKVLYFLVCLPITGLNRHELTSRGDFYNSYDTEDDLCMVPW